MYGLEESIIRLCLRYKVLGERSPHTGVWVGDNKICAIGCRETSCCHTFNELFLFVFRSTRIKRYHKSWTGLEL